MVCCLFPLFSVKTTSLTWHFIFFLLVDSAGEGVSEGNGSKEHLNADDKVLPARRHSTGANLVSVDEKCIGNDATALQDGEDHSFKKTTFLNQFI